MAAVVAPLRPRTASSRTGFSLVEMLVVIAILAVLIALLMPAVQAAREAARRTQCGNHLRQIGIAFNSALALQERFPDGGDRWWSGRTMIGTGPATSPLQTWGWAYQVLPYLEQDSLWREPDNALVRSTASPVYFCPTRRPMTVYGGGALLDYVGNGGSTSEGAAIHNGPINRFDKQVLPAHVRDGLSNTILVAEKYVNSNWYQGGNWGDNTGYYCGWGWDSVRFGRQTPRVDAPGDVAGLYDLFGSAHAAAFQVAMCDGSVRPVGYEINATTLQNLSNRADGQAVDSSGL